MATTTGDKEFMSVFREIARRTQPWRVWSDFVELAACAISNKVDLRQYESREKRYMEIVGRYDRKEADSFAKLLAIIVNALDNDPEQDFLGSLFMQLELGNHWKGQFFTPYHLCALMAKLQVVDVPDKIATKGYVSVNDCACGAGALLIAFANETRRTGINYQQHVMFVGQDVDRTAAMMCYIQLSLLGCPGYVIVGDTLCDPPTDPPRPDAEVWYTPLYFSDIWHWRRLFRGIRSNNEQTPSNVAAKPVKAAPKPRKREENNEQVMQLTLF